MKTSRFSDSQILAILKQAEAGIPVSDLSREHGISSATFYKWWAKFGDMDAFQMAQAAVAEKSVSIKLPCAAFGISECCYRYQSKLSTENAEIADLLVRLTHNQRNWGFGLCFPYLRNVKRYPWNHKRVYRIYCELELNLRIKPKKSDHPGKAGALGGAGGHQRHLVDGLHARRA